MKKFFKLLITHLMVGAFGFAAGIYTLPILTAPDAPDVTEIQKMSSVARFNTAFKKDLQDSDFLHQGGGQVTVGDDFITFMGKLSPGPGYRLYLSPEFIETEDHFKRIKSKMVEVGDVKTFDNFVVKVDQSIDISKFNTVIVWCEAFEQFITAAQYQ